MRLSQALPMLQFLPREAALTGLRNEMTVRQIVGSMAQEGLLKLQKSKEEAKARKEAEIAAAEAYAAKVFLP